MDYYETLGLAQDASQDEIKKAYRALVKQVHPDSGDPGDVERFRAIQEAYETLSDPLRRRAYDARRAPVSWVGGFEEPLTPFREVRPRARPPVSPDGPVHLDIVLSPDEAMRGGDVVLEAPHERSCARCHGRGLDFFGWCGACRGEGWMRTRERITFRLTPGIRHGEIVRAKASGGRTVRAQIRIR